MRKIYAIILMVLLSFAYGMVPTYAAETAAQDGWIPMPSRENVALDKEWTVKFSSIVSNNLIAEIVIEKDASSIPVTITITGQDEVAKVRAVSPYVSNSKYALKVSLTNGKKYVMNFTTTSSEQIATDYSKAERWLSLPTSADKEVDIFYLYPTAWQKVDVSEPNICAIDNPSMLKGSEAAFDRQATAFEPVGNIYAPYYRQADAAYCLSLPLAEQEKFVGGIPKADAFAAFDYYIKNYNNGRPFILAGHSQGSNILVYLLSEYMKENPEVYDRMVAAYVIGYSVTDEYLAENPHLKFAEGPDDIGVIISYNTEAPKIEGNNPVVLPGANVINPIIWTREETLATAEESLGSTLPNKDLKFVPVGKYADARIDKAKGVLICSTADVEKLSPGNPVFGKGVYHSFDYPFYYYNIRENAANRIKSFASRLS